MQFFIKSFPQLLLLIFGGVIVLLSLLSANRVFSQGEGLGLTKQHLYFQEEVLPDHLLYPAIAGFDRLKLMIVNNTEEVNLRISYAWKRLNYTQALLAKGYQELSFSTLTKAYKYYLDALTQAQQLDLSNAEKKVLVENAQFFQLISQSLSSSFLNDQREELKRLADQHTVLLQFFSDSF